MKVLNVTELPDGSAEYIIDLTDAERKMIRKAKGWKRLTSKRIQSWFLETLKNTIEKEK